MCKTVPGDCSHLSRTNINLIQFFKCSRRNVLMPKVQLKTKSKKSRTVYHLVKVFDPVTKMDFQARFPIYSVVLLPGHRNWEPIKAMKQYLNQKDIKSSVRNCIRAMPDNPECYQLVFSDDYFWS